MKLVIPPSDGTHLPGDFDVVVKVRSEQTNGAMAVIEETVRLGDSYRRTPTKTTFGSTCCRGRSGSWSGIRLPRPGPAAGHSNRAGCPTLCGTQVSFQRGWSRCSRRVVPSAGSKRSQCSPQTTMPASNKPASGTASAFYLTPRGRQSFGADTKCSSPALRIGLSALRNQDDMALDVASRWTYGDGSGGAGGLAVNGHRQAVAFGRD